MAVIAVAATTHGRVLWYLTRGSGFVALLLLTASVVLGIVEVKRWATERWPRFVTAALHKNVSLLAVVFLGVHVATTVLDGFAPIGWLDAAVPFRSPYRPLWLGLGAVALDLLAALVVTSLVRGRIGYRAFKAVHWAAYACWPVALLHGLGTGTDTKLGFALLLNLACLGAVVLAVWWRLGDAWSRRVVPLGAAVGGAAASVAVPAGIVAFLVAGPLQPGWSRRAGTPAGLTGVAAPAAAPAAPPPTGPAFTGPFSDSLSGTINQSADGTTVVIDGDLTGSAPGHLRIVLQGQPADDGGIVMRQSAASLGPSGQPQLYRGAVRVLSGASMELALAGSSGPPLTVRVLLSPGGGTAVSGTVTGGPGGGPGAGPGGGQGSGSSGPGGGSVGGSPGGAGATDD